MTNEQFLIVDQETPVRLMAKRSAFYLQSEIIEACSEDNRIYYLFFYKEKYIAGYKASCLENNSFVAESFKKGIVLQTPHPLINRLLSSQDSYQLTAEFAPLLKKLKKRYHPQEQAYILTFFESFISKQELIDEIKSIFYVYRRNGQGFHGYRVIRVLRDFAPDHSWVREISGDSIFRDYATQYKRETEELLTKDPIFAEKVLYARKHENKSFKGLEAILEKESRWNDLVALMIFRFVNNPTENLYLPLKKLLRQHFNESDYILSLESLSEQTPDYQPLQQDLFDLYIKNQQLKKAAMVMQKNDFTPTENQSGYFVDMLEQSDLKASHIKVEQLSRPIQQIIKLHPENAEKVLHRLVVFMLETHEPSYIQKWLKPFQEGNGELGLFSDIDRMERMSDDLDQMGPLGKLYYKYGQLDKAIECFSWEMELKPDDTEPLQWLSKLYQKVGKEAEAKAYRQLYVSMQKQA
ncbi:hypothetical protein ACFO3D_00925 [Virgibacillus kekensis]|uniref:Tetratricopeptide repeat protein n=1 Tax=Virgibacillus kekensis TaxID=202261 RepID=A0ABV9DEC9_9BACI